MTGLAEALRATLAQLEAAQRHAKLSNHDAVAADALAALAAHDAAVQAGGWIVEAGTLTVSAPNWKGGDRPRVPVCYPQGTFNQAEHMDRIVACVNACQGIADPARLVAAVGDALAALRSQGVTDDAVEAAIDELDAASGGAA